jgi:predicted membrane chloride channel (bestrophin family)
MKPIKKFLTDKYYKFLYPVFVAIGTFLFKAVRSLITYTIIGTVSLTSYMSWFLYTKCESEVINVHEIRFYILLGIILAVLLTFATIRLYNAVYNNTAIMARLVKSMSKLTETVDDSIKENGRRTQQEKAHMSTQTSRLVNSNNDLTNSIHSLKNVFSNKRSDQ